MLFAALERYEDSCVHQENFVNVRTDILQTNIRLKKADIHEEVLAR